MDQLGSRGRRYSAFPPAPFYSSTNLYRRRERFFLHLRYLRDVPSSTPPPFRMTSFLQLAPRVSLSVDLFFPTVSTPYSDFHRNALYFNVFPLNVSFFCLRSLTVCSAHLPPYPFSVIYIRPPVFLFSFPDIFILLLNFFLFLLSFVLSSVPDPDRKLLDLLDPDPLVRVSGTDLDPSVIKQKINKSLDICCYVTS
jgi:hypothetical protein